MMFTPDGSLGGLVRGYHHAALSGAPERRTKRLSRQPPALLFTMALRDLPLRGAVGARLPAAAALLCVGL
jgi:hypothetical protein